MIRILFVCHGNICRSPMAQYVLEHLAAQQGVALAVESAATSSEELGNGMHPGTRRVLAAHGIPCGGHRARQLTRADREAYDWFIGMDSANVRNMLRILGGDAAGKICRLLEFTPQPRDIADPWYTGDFEATYQDVYAGCRALLEQLG